MCRIFTELIECVRREEVVLFVGSGFSIKAGAPSVKGVIDVLLNELTADEQMILAGNNQLDSVANEFCQMRNRDELIKTLERAFEFVPTNLSDHKMLSSIPHFKHIITTNYDNLIENAYGAKDVHVIRNDEDCTVNHDDKTAVYKLHGDFLAKDRIVVTKSDYTTFFNKVKGSPLWSVIESLFLKKHILFIGYSLEDENILDIITHIRGAVGNNMRQMFLISPSMVPHKKTRLSNLNVKYYQSKAEDFFEELINELNENIHYDYVAKKIGFSTLTRYAIQHKVKPIACQAGVANEVNYKIEHGGQFNITITVDKELGEKIINRDISIYNDSFPKTSSVPAIRIGKEDMQAFRMSVNDMVIDKGDKYSSLFLAPPFRKEIISVKIPDWGFNEKIEAEIYSLDGGKHIKMDIGAFKLSFEFRLQNGNSLGVRFCFSLQDDYMDNSIALRWIKFPMALCENVKVVLSLMNMPLQMQNSMDIEDFKRYEKYYQNIRDIELYYNVILGAYKNYTPERFMLSELLINSYRESYLVGSCDESQEIDADILGQLEEVKTLFASGKGVTMAMVQPMENPISFCGKDFTIKNKNIFMQNCEVISFDQVDVNKIRVKVRANKGDVLIRYSNKEINEMDGFEQLKQLSLS